MDKREIGRIAADLLADVRGELGLPPNISNRSVTKQPMRVKNLEGDPSYWFVPVAVKRHLVGFLRIGLQGELLSYGRFGQEQRLDEFPLLSYLSEITAKKEMSKAFGREYKEISPPQLVHDRALEKIAWLSTGKSREGTRVLLFWTFGSSYFRPADDKPEDGLI